jgi:hypothetical protein
MFDDFREIADALDVPLPWFWLIIPGFVALAAAGTTHSAIAGTIAALVGLGIASLGIRAIVRPSRPLRLSPLSTVPGITTSRRLGAFYFLPGVVWVGMSLLALTAR